MGFFKSVRVLSTSPTRPPRQYFAMRHDAFCVNLYLLVLITGHHISYYLWPIIGEWWLCTRCYKIYYSSITKFYLQNYIMSQQTAIVYVIIINEWRKRGACSVFSWSQEPLLNYYFHLHHLIICLNIGCIPLHRVIPRNRFVIMCPFANLACLLACSTWQKS
jgi:hypothetical protein